MHGYSYTSVYGLSVASQLATIAPAQTHVYNYIYMASF